jgi:hypothetical protein
MKTKPLPTQKSSTKPIPKVTRGFVSAHSPYWLKNNQQKLSRCRLKNPHQNTFQRWSVHSEALAAPVDSEKVNENWVGADWEIINETYSKGDAWIRESTQPLLIQKLSRKTKLLPTRKSSTKQLPQVTRLFVNTPTLVDSEIVNENWSATDSEIVNQTASIGDAWIRQRAHPYWLRNNQWKLSHCRLQNCQRNRFQRWRVDSSAPVAPFDLEIVNKNWVATDSEIITKTPSKGDAWIRKRLQPLLSKKKSTKMKSVLTQQSSTKTFHRWCLDSWEHTTPFDSEIVNKNQADVDSEVINEIASTGEASIRQHTHRVDSDKVNENWATAYSEIVNQTASTGDAWIRQRSQHLLI